MATRASRTALYRLARGLVEHGSAAYARPPPLRVLDVEDTEAPGHGAQAQARDAGASGGSCFLPLPRYAGRSGRLRTTRCKAKRFPGTPRLAVVQRLGTRLRHAWPDPLVRVRGDRPAASPEVRQWSAAHADLRDGTGLTSPASVPPRARAVVQRSQRASKRDGGTRTRFPSTRSPAGPWSRSRRVVSKGESRAQGVQTRVGVTAREAGAHQGALPTPGRCAGPRGTRAQGAQTLSDIGAPSVSSLRGPSVPVGCPGGGLWVTRYLAPRGVQAGAMGLGNAGDDPAPRPHTGSPRASVDGAQDARVPRVVSGRTAREAPWDLRSLRASGRAAPVRASESPDGSRAKRGREPPES